METIESLKQALAAKDEQLQTLQQQLASQKRLADLGALVAGIIHEIGNPLSMTYNYFTILSRDLNDFQGLIEALELGEISPEFEAIFGEFFGKIDRYTDTLEELLQRMRSLLNVMRLQSYDRDTSSRSALSLNKSIHSLFLIVEYSKTYGFHERIIYQENYDETIESLALVAEDLVKIIVNLLNNAFDSVIAKKQRLGEEYQPEIKITTTKTDSGAVIEILDNGEGIAKENIDRIFEAFFTTKPSDTGTGLGLSIVQRLVEKNQWSCEVDSEFGEFASFKLAISEKIASSPKELNL
jgi:signal transduction histidine kinase